MHQPQGIVHFRGGAQLPLKANDIEPFRELVKAVEAGRGGDDAIPVSFGGKTWVVFPGEITHVEICTTRKGESGEPMTVLEDVSDELFGGKAIRFGT